MCGNALWWLVIAAALFHELAGAKLPPCLGRNGAQFQAAEDKEGAPDLLFTQQAHEAVLEVLDADDIYAELGAILTLNDVAPTTTWFTDRPNRKAGHVPTGIFTSSPIFFKETSFGSDDLQWLGGPNALLTGLVVEEEEEGGARHPPASAVMTLYQPAYNLHSRTLTYKVTLIPKDGGREGKLGEDGVSTYALDDADDGLSAPPLHSFQGNHPSFISSQLVGHKLSYSTSSVPGNRRNITWHFPALFIDDYLAELPGTCTYQRFMAGNCTCPATRSDTYCGTDLGTVGQHPVTGAQFGVWGSFTGGSTLEGYNQFAVPNGYLYKSYYG